MLRDKKEPTITCPYCGYEYLPAEIFIPSSFFGHPEDIERNDQGIVDVYDGTGMCLEEEYICDNCGEKFTVTTEIKFKSKKKEAFNPIYSSPISQRISLFEGDSSDN